MIGNDIPEGQGSVTLLLSECFELTRELRDQAEAAAEQAERPAAAVSGSETTVTT